ncbi:hypothetical protein BDR26DRAFT_967968 [Obelidium mucronatum]|nr:hypothetical protein BDR26DRAFT_967968 [Obelidium mucronatum]
MWPPHEIYLKKPPTPTNINITAVNATDAFILYLYPRQAAVPVMLAAAAQLLLTDTTQPHPKPTNPSAKSTAKRKTYSGIGSAKAKKQAKTIDSLVLLIPMWRKDEPKIRTFAERHAEAFRDCESLKAKLQGLWRDVQPLAFAEANALIFERLGFPDSDADMFSAVHDAVLQANNPSLDHHIHYLLAKCAKGYSRSFVNGDCFSSEQTLPIFEAGFHALRQQGATIVKLIDGTQRLVVSLNKKMDEQLVRWILPGNRRWYCDIVLKTGGCNGKGRCDQEQYSTDYTSDDKDEVYKLFWDIRKSLISKIGTRNEAPSIQVSLTSLILFGSDACVAVGVKTFSQMLDAGKASSDVDDEELVVSQPVLYTRFYHMATLKWNLQDDVLPRISKSRNIVAPLAPPVGMDAKCINFFETQMLDQVLKFLTDKPSTPLLRNTAWGHFRLNQRFGLHLCLQSSFNEALANSISQAAAITFFGKPLGFNETRPRRMHEMQTKVFHTDYFEVARDMSSPVWRAAQAKKATTTTTTPPLSLIAASGSHSQKSESVLYVNGKQVTEDTFNLASALYTRAAEDKICIDTAARMIEPKLKKRIKSLQTGDLSHVFQSFESNVSGSWSAGCIILGNGSPFPASWEDTPKSMTGVVEAGVEFIRTGRRIEFKLVLKVLNGDTDFQTNSAIPDLFSYQHLCLSALFGGGTTVFLRESKRPVIHALTLTILDFNRLRSAIALLPVRSKILANAKSLKAASLSNASVSAMEVDAEYNAIVYLKSLGLKAASSVSFSSNGHFGYAYGDNFNAFTLHLVKGNTFNNGSAAAATGDSVARDLVAAALGSSCGVDKYQLEDDDGTFHTYKRSLNKGIASKKELLKLVSEVADRSKQYLICQRIFNRSMLANSGTEVKNPATLTMDFIVPASKDEEFIDMQCYGNHFIKLTTSTKASASISIHPVSLSFVEGKLENVGVGYGAREFHKKKDLFSQRVPVKRDVQQIPAAFINSKNLFNFLCNRTSMDDPMVLDDPTVDKYPNSMDEYSSPRFDVDVDEDEKMDEVCDNTTREEDISDDSDGENITDQTPAKLPKDKLDEIKSHCIEMMHASALKPEVPEIFNNSTSGAVLSNEIQREMVNTLIDESTAVFELLHAFGPAIIHLQSRIQEAVCLNPQLTQQSTAAIKYLQDPSYRIVHSISKEENLFTKFALGSFKFHNCFVEFFQNDPLLHVKDLLDRLNKLKVRGGPSWQDLVFLAMVMGVDESYDIIDDDDVFFNLMKAGHVGWADDNELYCSNYERTEEDLLRLKVGLVSEYLDIVCSKNKFGLDPSNQSTSRMLQIVNDLLKQRFDKSTLHSEGGSNLRISDIEKQTKFRVTAANPTDHNQDVADLVALKIYRELSPLQQLETSHPFAKLESTSIHLNIYHSFHETQTGSDRLGKPIMKRRTDDPPVVVTLECSVDEFLVNKCLMSVQAVRDVFFEQGQPYSNSIIYGQELNTRSELQRQVAWDFLKIARRSFSVSKSPTSERPEGFLVEQTDDGKGEIAKEEAAAYLDSLDEVREREYKSFLALIDPISWYYNVGARLMSSAPFGSLLSIYTNEIDDLTRNISHLIRNKSSIRSTFASHLGGNLVGSACDDVVSNWKGWVTKYRKSRRPASGMVQRFYIENSRYLSPDGKQLLPAEMTREPRKLLVNIQYDSTRGVWLKFLGHDSLVQPVQKGNRHFKHGLRAYGLQRGVENPRVSIHIAEVEVRHASGTFRFTLDKSRPIPLPTTNNSLSYELGAVRIGRLNGSKTKFEIAAPLKTLNLSASSLTKMPAPKLYSDVCIRPILHYSSKEEWDLVYEDLNALVEERYCNVKSINSEEAKNRAVEIRENAKLKLAVVRESLQSTTLSWRKKRKISAALAKLTDIHKKNLHFFETSLEPDVGAVDPGGRIVYCGMNLDGVATFGAQGFLAFESHLTGKIGGIQKALDDQVNSMDIIKQLRKVVDDLEAHFQSFIRRRQALSIVARWMDAGAEGSKLAEAVEVIGLDLYKQLKIAKLRRDSHLEALRVEASGPDGVKYRKKMDSLQQRLNLYRSNVIHQLADYHSRKEVFLTPNFDGQKFKGNTGHTLRLACHSKIAKMTENLMLKRTLNTTCKHSRLLSPEGGSTLTCQCGRVTRIGDNKIFSCSNPFCRLVELRDLKSADIILVIAFAIAYCLWHSRLAATPKTSHGAGRSVTPHS